MKLGVEFHRGVKKHRKDRIHRLTARNGDLMATNFEEFLAEWQVASLEQWVAQQFVGEVQWQTRVEGFCACPGEHLHTHPTSLGHCSVVTERAENGLAPGIYCFHASCAAVVAERRRALRRALGILGCGSSAGGAATWPEPTPRPAPVPDPVFVPEAAKKYGGRVKDEITPEWLAARSPICPWNRTPASFLHALYRPGEKVLVFDVYESQGQALWEHPGFPFDARVLGRFAKGAKAGVWFLTAPVDGEFRLGKRGKRTRRSEACVTAWRYMVVESDQGELIAQDWLKVLVRLPMNVCAIYEPGGNLPHALVALPPAPTKDEWDANRGELLPALVTLGADPKAMKAVQLSRLPQCERRGKIPPGEQLPRFRSAAFATAPLPEPAGSLFARLPWRLGERNADNRKAACLKPATNPPR